MQQTKFRLKCSSLRYPCYARGVPFFGQNSYDSRSSLRAPTTLHTQYRWKGIITRIITFYKKACLIRCMPKTWDYSSSYFFCHLFWARKRKIGNYFLFHSTRLRACKEACQETSPPRTLRGQGGMR